MRKFIVIFFILFALLLNLYSFDFPRYDFSFFKTAETALKTEEDDKMLNIDLSGYGYVGKEKKIGLYSRINFKAPFNKDLFSKSKFDEQDKLITDEGEVKSEVSVNNDVDKSMENDEKLKEEKEENFTKKWKLGFGIGLALRNTMGKNAIVFLGIAPIISLEHTTKTDMEKAISEKEAKIDIIADIDMGIRITWRGYSSFRMGVHLNIDFFGINNYSTYSLTGEKLSSENTFYDYTLLRKSLFASTRGIGYVKATIVNNKRKEDLYKINYSNKTRILGNGKIEKIKII